MAMKRSLEQNKSLEFPCGLVNGFISE